jgi:hypothetical protein
VEGGDVKEGNELNLKGLLRKECRKKSEELSEARWIFF